MTIIHLGEPLPDPSSSLPGGSSGPLSRPFRDIASLRGLASDGVCRAALVTEGAVGSYSTISTLPRGPFRGGEAVCFLWHFPRGCPHRALPGILPCEARTFLSQ